MSDAEGETKPDPKSSGGDIKDYVHKLADPALNYAAFKGHIDAVTKLLPKDETLFQYSPPLGKTTPLHYACLGGSMEVVNLFLEKMPAAVSARDSNRRSALHFAALGSNLDIVKLLLEKGPEAVIGEDSAGRCPLHYAALSGNTEIVDLLLTCLPRVVVRDGLRATPLHYAALGGNVECVRRLLKENMRIYETDKFGATPLHYAALGHNLQSLNVLNFSNETICTLKEFEESPLSLLAFKGVLSSGHPQDFWRHKENIFPWTSCKEHQMSELAHKWKGHYEVFELLLENGADVSLKDMCRGTLLHYAAYGGNPKIFDKALEQITNANQVDWWNRKPLVYAALGGNLEIFEQHFDDGTYKHELDKSSPGEWYCIGPQKFAKKYPDADGNLCSETDQTLLHYAAVGGNAKVFELSLRHVADVKSRDKNGSTPLHYAALGGNLKIVALLLDKGASVDIRNKDGRAPLHYAAVRGSQAVFDFFAARDLTASTLSDASGFTPDAYFKMRTQKDPIVDLSIHVLQTKRVEQMQEGQAKEKLSGAKTEIKADLDETSSTLAAKSGYSERSLATETTEAHLDDRDDPISCLNKMSLHTSGEDPEEKGTDLMTKSHSEEWQPADLAEMPVLTVIEATDVSYELSEVDHPLLELFVKDYLLSRRLFLLPKTICVYQFDHENAKLPVKVRVNVSSILLQLAQNEKSSVEDGLFILCKANAEVTDITTRSRAQMQGKELVFLCHHFSEFLIGWTTLEKIIQRIITAWTGTFRARLCPSATREGNILSLALLCHTPYATECPNHECDKKFHSPEVHCNSNVRLVCTWFSDKGMKEEVPSAVIKVDMKTWEISGQPITAKAYVESILPSSLVMELSSELENKWVTIGVKDNIKIMQEKPEAVYPKIDKGLVVIVNNINFEAKTEEKKAKLKRSGSEYDEDRVKGLFTNTLTGSYDVLSGDEYRDCSLQRIKDIVSSVQTILRKKRHQQLIFFIFSHGDQNGILTSDLKHIRQEEIIGSFQGDRLREMMELPKAFVFQACRGSMVNAPVQTDDGSTLLVDEDGDSLIHIPVTVPPNAHMVTAYATTEGHYAFRLPSTGSVYISELCNVVAENFRSRHFTDMLTLVQGKVSSKTWLIKIRGSEEETPASQMPTFSSTLTKSMYLYSMAGSDGSTAIASGSAPSPSTLTASVGVAAAPVVGFTQN